MKKQIHDCEAKRVETQPSLEKSRSCAKKTEFPDLEFFWNGSLDPKNSSKVLHTKPLEKVLEEPDTGDRIRA